MYTINRRKLSFRRFKLQCHRVFTVVHFLQIFYAVIFFTNAEFLGPGHIVGPGDSAFLQKIHIGKVA